MDITQRIALGYRLETETAEYYRKLYSLASNTHWTREVETKLNEVLGWDYDDFPVRQEIRKEQLKLKAKIESEALAIVDKEAKRNLKEAQSGFFTLIAYSCSCILLVALLFFSLDTLATNWVRMTRNCNQMDQCQL